MADDRLAASLQESVLTALAFDDSKAQALIGVIDAGYFEGSLRDVAARILDYRSRFHKAPGEGHLDDLMVDLLDSKDARRAKSYARIMSMLLDQSKHLNIDYVMAKATQFARSQQLKLGIYRAGERYQQGGETVVEEVEGILFDTVKQQVQALDAGVFLSDPRRALGFLEARTGENYRLGIPEFDRRGIGPTKGEMLMLLGPRGRGKSWMLTHCGRQCVMQRAKVCHITLEMSEERVIQRYFQSFFSIAKRDEEYEQIMLEFDELKRLSGLRLKKKRPKLDLMDPKIGAYLKRRMDQWGARLSRLVVKQFPSGQLTVRQLDSYLDGLAMVHDFVPDVLIIDYPDLMKLDQRDLRASIGRVYVELRGQMAVQRHLALVVVSQVNRAGEDIGTIRSIHAAEDISKLATVDTALTYNQSVEEKVLGLARLQAIKVRNDEDGTMVLVTQNYKTGQFVLQSALFEASYWKHLDVLLGKDDKDGDDEED